MQANKLSAYIVPSGDEFMNEYVPAYARRLEFLTCFTGSAGMAIILENKAAFFTDGRYILQAASQLPKGEYEIINTADVKPAEWLKNNLQEGGVIGLNPMLYSKDNILKYKAITEVSLCDDLIDLIWENKPQKPASQVKIHHFEHSGRSHQDKIFQILKVVKDQNADMLFITAPDSICWLLNIRGGDVPNTPLVLARLLLEVRGDGILFVDLDDAQVKENLTRHLGDRITIQPLNRVNNFVQETADKNILLDKTFAPYLFFSKLEKNNTLVEITDPCTLPKACKNSTEISGSYDAHLRDGVAVTSFLFWLENNFRKQNVTEISASDKLIEFRRKDKAFVEPSFDTIAGFASNAAIVHYKASVKTNKTISGNNLFLLDSGGQYFTGTTDITRTIAIGKASSEQKRNFTLVLKGHIAVATAVFPEGTTGHQIDILARQYLWKNGLDYDHGTGHGVGSFLGVHEGPQRISKAPSDVALTKGMIISNEPGYYENGKYGIRIENLVVVDDANLSKSNRKFLCFKTLTCVPIDPNLVDFSMLDGQEKKWLQEYHTSICKKLSPLLSKEICEWLANILNFYNTIG